MNWSFARRLLLLVALSTSGAHAAPTPDELAAANALYDEGVRLMAAGKYAEALPKLTESQRLDPGLGTMLRLAECYGRLGRTASAWALFREAESVAEKQGDARVKLARDKREQLEGRLIRLVVSVPASSELPDMQITRNGAPLNRALWGTALPIDPGDHVLLVTAKGREPWQARLSLLAEGRTETLVVPRLRESIPVATPSVSVTPPQASAPSPNRAGPARIDPVFEPEPAKPAAPPNRGVRVVGVGAAIVGAAALGVGAYFFVRAGSLDDESNSFCKPKCDSKGESLRGDAELSRTVSTALFVGGSVAIVGGMLLAILAPGGKVATTDPPKTSRMQITPIPLLGGGGLWVTSRF